MPFYEYQCAACGHHHEELQKVGDRPLRKCPSCGRSTLKRLVSAPVFRLKGGGWYETDFKGDKDNQRNLAGEKEPPAEKPADTKTKTEAKPAEAAKPASDAKTAPVTADQKPAAASPPKAAVKRRTLRRRRPRT